MNLKLGRDSPFLACYETNWESGGGGLGRKGVSLIISRFATEKNA